MLVIGLRAGAAGVRPKYFPVKLWKQWVVIDGEDESLVFGPDSLTACQHYIADREKNRAANCIGGQDAAIE